MGVEWSGSLSEWDACLAGSFLCGGRALCMARREMTGRRSKVEGRRGEVVAWRGGRGLMVRESCDQKFAGSSLGLAYHDWGALEQSTEPLTAPQAPWRGCPLLRVRMHLGWVKCRDLDYISLLIIPCIIYYVTNKETLNISETFDGSD